MSDDTSAQEKQPDKLTFTCDKCNKEFQTARALQGHKTGAHTSKSKKHAIAVSHAQSYLGTAKPSEAAEPAAKPELPKGTPSRFQKLFDELSADSKNKDNETILLVFALLAIAFILWLNRDKLRAMLKGKSD